ncbi:MAG: substrate-binding domain-containing protein [Nitrospirae bacterium]|nr:substrate-binding domain-containing protein [Magnetococcales bacterium]
MKISGSIRFFVAIFCCVSSSMANPTQAMNQKEMSALEFSDPAQKSPRSEEWQARPIRYDSWAQNADIAVTLDQHQYAALRETIQTFSMKSGLRVSVVEGTCGTSEAMLDKKQVDIAGFCCPPATTDRLPGVRFHTLGISALAILVHHGNPVQNLTVAELRAIFSGRITHWSQVSGVQERGGWDFPIRAVGRLHCKLRPGHWRTLLPDENAFSAQLVEVGTVPDMIASVAGNQGAIGYDVLWNRERFDRGGLVKVVRVDGVSPEDDQAVAEGRYPFYQVSNITSWDSPGTKNSAAASLVAYLGENAPVLKNNYRIVSSEWLRKNGWRFEGDELIGNNR